MKSMKKGQSQKLRKEYPESTAGSGAAARGRAKANKMTESQRQEYFRKGMVYCVANPS